MSRTPHLRELDSRTSNGVTVTLPWNAASGGVSVVVVDEPGDDAFVLDVAGADAFDAFHHPYAYAAQRAVPEPIAA